MEKIRLIIRSQEELDFHLNSLLGIVVVKPLVVTVGEYKKKRSLSQNRLMWKLFEVLSSLNESCCYTENELHTEYGKLFLQSYVVNGPLGPVLRVKSTTELNTKEMSEHIDKIIANAAEMGWFLPNDWENYGRD